MMEIETFILLYLPYPVKYSTLFRCLLYHAPSLSSSHPPIDIPHHYSSSSIPLYLLFISQSSINSIAKVCLYFSNPLSLLQKSKATPCFLLVSTHTFIAGQVLKPGFLWL
jgi:hypothetical protein